MDRKGFFYALAAYGIWGFFPVYWKLLKDVPALQLLSHRIAWSFVLMAIVIAVSGQWKPLREAVRQPGTLRIYTISALLVGLNWFIYVWAVNANHVVDASLGYFINPLVSVLLGVIFLRERLRPLQWVPVGLAAAGVLVLTAAYGKLPWIALALALSFGLYGLVKKIAPLNSLYGVTLETAVLVLPAVGYLAWQEAAGTGKFMHLGLVPDLLMIGAGLVTTVPLLMFSSAAQRIPLTMVGIIQYITPTIQFLLGVFVFGEPFDPHRLLGFCIVWAALVFFTVEGFLAHRSAPKVADRSAETRSGR
jgi:chloramphenicol-sensitive protein RarD